MFFMEVYAQPRGATRPMGAVYAARGTSLLGATARTRGRPATIRPVGGTRGR